MFYLYFKIRYKEFRHARLKDFNYTTSSGITANNAVDMLRRCIGVDVMTTFADVQAINTSDKNTTATQDDLAKVERSLYNALGLSKNLFNTDGNLSLEKSILDDESTVRNLLLQFAIFYDTRVSV